MPILINVVVFILNIIAACREQANHVISIWSFKDMISWVKTPVSIIPHLHLRLLVAVLFVDTTGER